MKGRHIMTDEQVGRWINATVAVSGAIIVAALVAGALAKSGPVRPDHEVSASTTAPSAAERQFERGGSMMGYEILW
jgi:hypothetical protein